MKKILVVLLVLAVAGGVFAQGSFRLSGNVEIGTRLNFDHDGEEATRGDNRARAGGVAYNWWDNPRGQFQIRYQNEGLNAGLRFNTRGGGSENEPFFTYAGENFSFKTGLFGNALFTAGNNTSNTWFGSIGDTVYLKWLWGEYKFLDGLVDLLVAYRSEELEFWVSDTTAGSSVLAVGAAMGTEAYNHSGGGGQNGWHHNFFGKPATFSYVDHDKTGNFLMTNVNLDALNFGILIPGLFGQNALNSAQPNAGNNVSYTDEDGYSGGFVDGVLKQSVFGVKFSMSPVEFAAQLKVDNYGVYFGGRFYAGPIVTGLSFSGLLFPSEDVNKFIKIGGDVAYNAGVFGAGLAASLERHTDADNGAIYDQIIRIQPRFFYNAIPTHLSFALDAGFYFFNRRDVDGAGVELKDSDMTWAVQPQLFWTFLGTGARNGYGWAGPFYMGAPTGMIVRYRVASKSAEKAPGVPIWSPGLYSQHGAGAAGWQSANALDVIFSWNF